MSDIYTKSLIEVRDLLASGTISATDATRACLQRVQDTEPKLHALLHVMKSQALETAAALDKAGPDPAKPLWGVPITIKDLIAVKDAPNTCGSKFLDNFKPFYDAHLVQKLKDAGAVIIGKNNLDEFAMGSATDLSAYGPTHNPWDVERVPGGSSGGSAASVSACQCFASVGTDTGGSVRAPAFFCGCVGLKPSYGRISRYGLVAYASSLDQPGPLTRTVADATLMLQVMAGHDEKDSTCSPTDVPDYMAMLDARKDLNGLRFGLPKQFWQAGMDQEVETPLRAAVEKIKELGGQILEVDLPHQDYAVATYYIIAVAEASSNLARFDGVRYGVRDKSAEELIDLYVQSRTAGFGDEVQRRIMLGTYVLSAGYYDAYYRKAAQVRRLLRQDFLNAFEQCDVILGPVSPVTAWKIGEFSSDPLKAYLMDIYTLSLNLAGLPGLSLPVGLGDASNMPVGMQMIGRAFEEGTILSAANVLEKGLPTLGVPKGV